MLRFSASPAPSVLGDELVSLPCSASRSFFYCDFIVTVGRRWGVVAWGALYF